MGKLGGRRVRRHPHARPGCEPPRGGDPAEVQWLRTNVHPQRQTGYAAVRVRVPGGDLSPLQLRGLAILLRDHAGNTTRIGVDQSLLLRFVPVDRLRQLRVGLLELGLGQSNASGLGDTVTCPGSDTCKLGITSPRSVNRLMLPQLDALARHPRLEKLRIHISGCPNSCAQHQIADIGFFGTAKTQGAHAAPHFALLLGGLAGGQPAPGALRLGSGFGIPIIKLPARHIGAAVERLCALYLKEAAEGEVFGAFARRMGRAGVKALLEDLRAIPSIEEAPEHYRQPEHDEPFAVVRGVGECAGEVVTLADMLLARADQAADLAADAMEAEQEATAAVLAAHEAFRLAGQALISLDGLENPKEYDLVSEFRSRFYESGRIFEGVGHYFLAAAEEEPDQVDGDRLRRLVVEAGLFVEEAHSILAKLRRPAPRMTRAAQLVAK